MLKTLTKNFTHTLAAVWNWVALMAAPCTPVDEDSNLSPLATFCGK